VSPALADNAEKVGLGIGLHGCHPLLAADDHALNPSLLSGDKYEAARQLQRNNEFLQQVEGLEVSLLSAAVGIHKHIGSTPASTEMIVRMTEKL
jgi:hypothetical protein